MFAGVVTAKTNNLCGDAPWRGAADHACKGLRCICLVDNARDSGRGEDFFILQIAITQQPKPLFSDENEWAGTEGGGGGGDA